MADPIDVSTVPDRSIDQDEIATALFIRFPTGNLTDEAAATLGTAGATYMQAAADALGTTPDQVFIRDRNTTNVVQLNSGTLADLLAAIGGDSPDTTAAVTNVPAPPAATDQTVADVTASPADGDTAEPAPWTPQG